ncbi:hypothetical protein DV515_00006426 [Chloebia gouldiae]|uniref:Uncharacterized protein n=1 Tax=Chloebia gouldiae TaxID=44316 RepID=A0A3L8SKE0_CHLGU|nr:hypothetical protein DV515_00006426 [Chloebia gouldiae]
MGAVGRGARVRPAARGRAGPLAALWPGRPISLVRRPEAEVLAPPAAVPWRKDGGGHGLNGTRRGPSGERGRDLSPVLNRRAGDPKYLWQAGPQLPPGFPGAPSLLIPWDWSFSLPSRQVGLNTRRVIPPVPPCSQLPPFFPSCTLCLLLVMSAFTGGYPGVWVAPFIPLVSSCACVLPWLPPSPPGSLLMKMK